MECLWHNIVNFGKVLWSYIVAVARLCVWTVILFFSGLQRTLFMRSEVVGVDFKVIPIRCYREEAGDKLAYLDKLCIENPDLMIVTDGEDVPFGEDVPYVDEEIVLDDEEDVDFNPEEDNGEDEE